MSSENPCYLCYKMLVMSFLPFLSYFFPFSIRYNMGNNKIAIVGAGSVGATIAYAVMLRDVVSEILLVDVVPEVVHGQILDLSDANLLSSTLVRGATAREAGQADIIVITAGAKQKEGESRTEVSKGRFLWRRRYASGLLKKKCVPLADRSQLQDS